MNDIVAVQIDQCLYGLGDIVYWLHFWKELLLSELVEKRRFAELEDQIKIGSLLVVPVELKTVLMLQKRLNLYLIDQTLDQFGTNFRKRYLLDSSQKLSCIMLSPIYIAESSFSKNLPKFEFLEKW